MQTIAIGFSIFEKERMSRVETLGRRPLKPSILTTVMLIMCISGCGAIEYRVHANQELDEKEVNNTRANIFFNQSDLEPPIKPFVGIAISGGGSRSANFSAAVLEELERLGFLEHVTAISSVSGGSLTAAYYGLFKKDREKWNWRSLRRDMRTNFFSKFGWRYFSPHNWLLTKFTTYDRSNVMAEIFDKTLYHNTTFEDWGKGLPRILINTTAFNSSFSLMTDDVFDELNSSSASYPISHAVMASGAFPGAFNNVTLRDFSPPAFFWNEKEIIDPAALAKKLKYPEDPLSEFIWRNLKDNWKEEIGEFFEKPLVVKSFSYKNLNETLQISLNELMEDLFPAEDDLLAPKTEGSVAEFFGLQMLHELKLSPKTKSTLLDNPDRWSELQRFRYLLEVFYHQEIMEQRPLYFHFFDGGPIDNLGVSALGAALSEYQDVYIPKGTVKQESCFLFIIDAYNQDDESRTLTQYRPDSRTFLDFVLDSNALEAANDMLMINRAASFSDLIPSKNQKRLIRALKEVLQKEILKDHQRIVLTEAIKGDQDEAVAGVLDEMMKTLSDEEVEAFEDAIYDAIARESGLLRTRVMHLSGNRGYTCLVWDINFDSLQRIVYFLERGEQLGVKIQEKARMDGVVVLRKLLRFIPKIATHYKLTGPDNCSAEEIQGVLYDAAYILLNEDRYVLDKTFNWFRTNFDLNRSFVNPLNEKRNWTDSKASSCAWR